MNFFEIEKQMALFSEHSSDNIPTCSLPIQPEDPPTFQMPMNSADLPTNDEFFAFLDTPDSKRKF